MDNSDFTHDITSFTHARFVTGLQKTNALSMAKYAIFIQKLNEDRL